MATNIDLEALKRLRGGLNPIAPEDAIFNDAPAQARGMDMVPVPVQKLDISQVPSRPDPTATDSQPSDLTRSINSELLSPSDCLCKTRAHSALLPGSWTRRSGFKASALCSERAGF